MLEILSAIFNFYSLFYIFLGVVLGTVIGMLPGLSAVLGVALLMSFTYSMEPLIGILFLIGVYQGAIYGGSISAIFLGIPGTPAAVATTMDGYPMAKRGEGGLAMGIATIASATGGLLGVIVLLIVARPIASFALAFGPREIFALCILALVAISQFSGGSILRAFISVGIGLFLATIGIDEMHGIPRFAFGNLNLKAGMPFVPIMIGIFALPEIFLNIESLSTMSQHFHCERVLPSLSLLKKSIIPIFKSTIIGTFIGAVPGTGADVAAIVSYTQAKATSKNPELFGTGYYEGLLYAESANNAATGGAMVPLLTLGIPGGGATAVLLGAFIIHGLRPGPLLLSKNPEFFYKLVLGMFVAYMFVFLALSMSKIFSKISLIPIKLVAPVILLLCVIGAYSYQGSVFHVYLMVVFGLLGYFFLRIKIPRPPLVIALIIGGLIESNFARSLLYLRGNVMNMFTPISTFLYVLSIFLIAFNIYNSVYRRHRKATN